MDYDNKKAIKKLSWCINLLSDLIINEEDSSNPDKELISFLENKQSQLATLTGYFKKPNN